MLIVADGFSCKTQIADARTGRRALPTGQMLAMAGKREPGADAPVVTAAVPTVEPR